tara:strand:+ start:121 stop:1023 length:903 start_codon:yes stop_codon:yes gene_type:complete
MAEEKMVDIDTSGEGQEVELQGKEEKEEKVEAASEENTSEETPVVEEEENKDDGLDKYSKNVQRRIKKLLDRVEKTEQRETEALRFAETAKKKAEDLENKMKSLDENYISEYESRVKSQIEQTKKALTDARFANDVNAEVDAQRALTRLAIEEERALASKQQREALEKQKEGLMTETSQQQPAQRQPDPRAEEWAEENKWFGQDEAMTFTALAHHKKLLKEGLNPKSDEYYEEINVYMKDQFPHKFNQETKEVKEKAPQVVASASRSQKTSGSRKVKLTPSQVAIAKKLGVPLEEYAKYV